MKRIRIWIKRLAYGTLGFLYAMSLTFAGALLGGAGHGTTLILDFGALALRNDWAKDIWLAPVFWFLFGCLFAERERKIPRTVLCCLLGVPYLVLIANALQHQYPVGDLVHVIRAAPLLGTLVLAYWLASQGLILKSIWKQKGGTQLQ